MIKNKLVNVVITKDVNGEILCFERTKKSINELISSKTKLILATSIESKLFKYITSISKEKAEVIIEWLILLEDEENTIHSKPFIGNKDILKYIKNIWENYDGNLKN